MDAPAELVADFRLEYTYKRSVGPVVGRFLASLREARLEGVRCASGEVLFPPKSYDPRTGEATGELVGVGPEGAIVLWSTEPGDPPRTWALIRLDGADVPFLHRVLSSEADLGPEVRVRPVWAAKRVGHIDDLLGFEVVP